jgi:hypothetical protein
MGIDAEVEECFGRLLEILSFLNVGFLRIWLERGFKTEDLANALAGLAVSAIESLKAAILLNQHDDCQGVEVMIRRFEEHFTLMIYFTLCDDGHMLARWFKNPKMVLSERNHKIRRAVDAKVATFFRRNPGWSFRDRFQEASSESVHATWHSVMQSFFWAAGRHGLVTPEARDAPALGHTLIMGRAITLLGAIGPSAGRFIEFLEKMIFTMPEFADASPGKECLAKLDDYLMRWWLTAGQLVDDLESREKLAVQNQPADLCQATAHEVEPAEGEPHSSDNGGQIFESEIHRLNWLIERIEERVTNCHNITPPDSPGSVELLVVTSSWMVTCLTQAKAVLTLLVEDLQAGAGPLFRTLWELWIDWRYLLRVGNRCINASKVLLNAQLEALEYFETLPQAVEPGQLSRIRANIQKFEREHAGASKQIREQREKGRHHWSGLTYSAMERELAPGPSLYRPLSWEAHAVMGPIRDVAVNVAEDATYFQFAQRDENTVLNQSFLAFSSGGALFYIYNEYADMWGLPAIDLLKPADGKEAGQ